MTTITHENGQYYLRPKEQNNTPIFLSAGLGSLIEELRPDRESPIHKGSSFIAPLHAPDTVLTAHKLYIEAGADIITTDTFCASYYRQGGNAELTEKFVTAACDIAESARSGLDNAPLIAVSLTSLEDCYSPEATPDIDTLVTEHKRNLALLENHGDFTLAETIPTLHEAAIIAYHARRPFIVSFTVGEDGNLLDGNNVNDVVTTILEPNALCLGIGVNCCSLEGAKKAVSQLAEIFAQNDHLHGKQIIAYPNGFKKSRAENNEENSHSCGHHHAPEKLSEIELAGELWDLAARGATAVGGCCGAGPSHTKAYISKLSDATNIDLGHLTRISHAVPVLDACL